MDHHGWSPPASAQSPRHLVSGPLCAGAATPARADRCRCKRRTRRVGAGAHSDKRRQLPPVRLSIVLHIPLFLGDGQPWPAVRSSPWSGKRQQRRQVVQRAQVRRRFLESRSPDARREGPRPRAAPGPRRHPAPCGTAAPAALPASASPLALPAPPPRALLQPLFPTTPPLRPAPRNRASLPPCPVQLASRRRAQSIPGFNLPGAPAVPVPAFVPCHYVNTATRRRTAVLSVHQSPP